MAKYPGAPRDFLRPLRSVFFHWHLNTYQFYRHRVDNNVIQEFLARSGGQKLQNTRQKIPRGPQDFLRPFSSIFFHWGLNAYQFCRHKVDNNVIQLDVL